MTKKSSVVLEGTVGDTLNESRIVTFNQKIAQTNTGADLRPFDLVYNNIYVGGTPNVDTGVYPHVDAVLNLRAESQLTLNATATLWMPIWDRPPFPGIDYLDTAVRFLESNYERGWETYVHCNLGVSRSSMVVIAFIMKQQRLKVEKAWALYNEKRPAWPNSEFQIGLFSWENYLKDYVWQKKPLLT